MNEGGNQFICSICNKSFLNKYNRDRHIRNTHSKSKLRIAKICDVCNQYIKNQEHLNLHKLQHKPKTKFTILESAFNKKCIIYRRKYDNIINNFIVGYLINKKEIKQILKYELLKKRFSK